MKFSNLVKIHSNKNHRIWITFILFTCLTLFTISCSETSTNTTDATRDTGELTTSSEVSYNSILSSGMLSEIASKAGKANRGNSPVMNTEAGFSSPLFGLATAPNADILVADAGSGISTSNGSVDIPLPGVSDMSPLGRGSMWAIKGLTGDPGDDTGQALYRVSKGKNRMLVDLFAFENTVNPDTAELIDSNPFEVQSLGGEAALVADAGGNDLLQIDNRGNIEVLAIFPDEFVPTSNIKDLIGCPKGPTGICGLPEEIPAQAVPTSIAIGPDGYYYIGELKGFPAPTNESNVWRVAPGASWTECGSSPDCQKVFDGGFTSIIDLTFDEDGNLYVVELEERSWFALESSASLEGGTINKCSIDTGTCTEVATGIPIITAITFGNDGTLWATENALIPGSADVIEID